MTSEPTRESILAQIAQIQRMDRGTLGTVRRSHKRVYYNHQCYEHGRNVSRYVRAEELPQLEEAFEGYARFRDLTEQYARLVIAQTRAARRSGSKKSSRNASSSAGTRKSSN